MSAKRLAILFFAAVCGGASPVAAEPRAIQPLLAKYCADCHSAGNETQFSIDMLSDPQRVRNDRRLVAKLTTMLESGKMPPADEAQPTMDERQQLVEWIASAARPDPAAPVDALDPGRVVMRRLSRYEYANTVRDLFSMSKPVWKYFAKPGTDIPEKGIEYSKRTYNLPWNLPPDEVDYGFDNIGEVLTLPPHLLESYFEVSGLVIDRVMHDTVPDSSTGDRTRRPKVLAVRPGPNRDEETAARLNLAVLAERAFRRPVSEAEVERLVALFRLARKNEPTFDAAMEVPLRALLISPDFLFRAERAVAGGQEVRPLDDYELASRLSYFLWSSMPDAELFKLARAGQLSDPTVLEQQVRRMLVDPRAESLAEHFAPQWLQIADIQASMPDPMLYPAFYQRFLGRAMRTEAIMLFDSVVVRDRSVLDLISADTTFINDKLCAYYGLKTARSNRYESFAMWRETPLPEGRRAGVLSLAAVSVVTSTPTRSSPVKRGKWVLETILGDPPPPPPPNVEQIKEEETGPTGPITFREKLKRHRTSVNCAACHQAMDPLGFALENFDAIGQWRERDGEAPVDAVGTLKDGTRICGAEGLSREILANRRDDFARCLTEHLLTFALGRKREWYDQAAVEQIVSALKRDDYRFSTLAVEIVKSRPFRFTRQAVVEADTVLTKRGEPILADAFDKPPGKSWHLGKGRWETVDGALRGAEVASEGHAASARHPLACRDVVIRCSVKLDGAKLALIKLNGTKGHCCQLIVTPAGLSLQQHVDPTGAQRWTVMDKHEAPIQPGIWHAVMLEIRGDEIVGSLDGQPMVIGQHESIGVDKTTLILNITGESASFKDLRLWKALPNEAWKAKKARLRPAVKAS